MKTSRVIVPILAIALAAVGLNAGDLYEGSRISLAFYGGPNYIQCGGVNYYIAQHKNYVMDFAQSAGWAATGDLKPIHWGSDWAGEIGFRLAPRWMITVGSGYMRSALGPGDNMLEVASGTKWFKTTGDTAFSVIPITLSLRFAARLAGRVFLTASAGPGIYLIKLKNAFVFDRDTGSHNSLSVDVDGTAYGAQGSLGFEFRFSPHFALLLEAIGRYAKCDSLSGDSTSGMPIPGSPGSLYFFRLQGLPLFLTQSAPPPSALTDVRTVNASVSGGAVRLGLRIGF